MHSAHTAHNDVCVRVLGDRRRTPNRTGTREKSNWMRRKILKLLVSNCNNFHYYFFLLVSNLMNQRVVHVFLISFSFFWSPLPRIHAYVSGERAWTTLNTSVHGVCAVSKSIDRLLLKSRVNEKKKTWNFDSPCSSESIRWFLAEKINDGNDARRFAWSKYRMCVKLLAASTPSPSSLHHNH